jgi:hypothetical protein
MAEAKCFELGKTEAVVVNDRSDSVRNTPQSERPTLRGACGIYTRGFSISNGTAGVTPWRHNYFHNHGKRARPDDNAASDSIYPLAYAP